MSNRSRLLLLDDEPEFLEVLQTWFARRGYEVSAAPDAVEGLALLRSKPFDVAIIDLRLPGIDGLQFQTLAREIAPQMDVIFLTGHGSMDDAIAALREGRAFDFLTKPIRNLHQLQVVVEKAIARRAGGDAPPPVAPSLPSQPSPFHRGVLSSREAEIVAFVAQGLSNREIGERLHLSDKTVKNHLSRIYEKLQVSNRTQAVVLCQRFGLTEGPT